MTDRPYRGPIDHERLGAYLRVLSVPTRILLLQKLQTPQTAAEIRLPPFRRDERYGEARALSRQGVEAHILKLAEVGLVRAHRARHEGRSVEMWAVNPARLFTVVDEMRRLALLRAAPMHATAQTADAGQNTFPPPPLSEEASLVLVSGPQEGIGFALSGDGPWTLGRGPDADVAVPHDPYVSSMNARLTRHSGEVHLSTLSSSRNGTTHNWRLLAPEESIALKGGDTVGVGRSLLVYREGRD